jgi:hypothetical protein
MAKCNNLHKLEYTFTIDPKGFAPTNLIADAVAKVTEMQLMKALSMPSHMLTGPTSYSAQSPACADAFACSLHAAKVQLDRYIQREQAICTIWGQLLAAGIRGNLRPLAQSLWIAEQCFDRSLEALAKHHHLGRWAQKRLE